MGATTAACGGRTAAGGTARAAGSGGGTTSATGTAIGAGALRCVWCALCAAVPSMHTLSSWDLRGGIEETMFTTVLPGLACTGCSSSSSRGGSSTLRLLRSASIALLCCRCCRDREDRDRGADGYPRSRRESERGERAERGEQEEEEQARAAAAEPSEPASNGAAAAKKEVGGEGVLGGGWARCGCHPHIVGLPSGRCVNAILPQAALRVQMEQAPARALHAQTGRESGLPTSSNLPAGLRFCNTRRTPLCSAVNTVNRCAPLRPAAPRCALPRCAPLRPDAPRCALPRCALVQLLSLEELLRKRQALSIFVTCSDMLCLCCAVPRSAAAAVPRGAAQKAAGGAGGAGQARVSDQEAAGGGGAAAAAAGERCSEAFRCGKRVVDWLMRQISYRVLSICGLYLQAGSQLEPVTYLIFFRTLCAPRLPPT